MDPNPSSFLPLFFDPYNSTNLSTIIYIYHLSLSKLPPTSDIAACDDVRIIVLLLLIGSGSTASSTYYQIYVARLVIYIYILAVAISLPAAGATGEIITTSMDYEILIFLNFPTTGPVARAAPKLGVLIHLVF